MSCFKTRNQKNKTNKNSYYFQLFPDLYRLQFWNRSYRSEYFPAFSIDNNTLIGYLRSMKISPNYKVTAVRNGLLQWILDIVRILSHLFEASVLVIGLLTAAVAILTTE